MAAESPACTNWLEVGALGLHRAPKALYSVGLTKVPWKEPASDSLYDGAPSNGANLFLLSQVQYSPSLPDDKPGKYCHLPEDEVTSLRVHLTQKLG